MTQIVLIVTPGNYLVNKLHVVQNSCTLNACQAIVHGNKKERKMTKITSFKNGSDVITEKNGAWYSVILRNPSGEVHDKIRCDDYRMALEYVRAFKAIAKNL